VKLISVYSAKGGVGKTATAVNLAFLSARAGNRTLLWDLDPQSSATFYLRIQPKVRGGGKSLIRKKGDIAAAIRGTDYEGFDLLPGDFSYRKFDLLLNKAERAAKRFRRIHSRLAKEYDALILDCPPGFTLTSEALLRLSDLVMIPTIPTPLSLRSLELLGRYVEKKQLDAQRFRPFFSMVDRRKSLHRSVCEEVTDHPFRFLEPRIPYSTFVEQMGVRRAPLSTYAEKSLPARAFADLWAAVRAELSL
jgi:chromosome partitioning protein